jgi:preprotein translocase subunit YajC
VDQTIEVVVPLVFILILLWLINRSRRQSRQMAQTQEELHPGLHVMTTSGLHGTVIALEEPDLVVLEIADGVHTRWDRRAIALVVRTETAGDQADHGSDSDSDPDDAGTYRPADPGTAARADRVVDLTDAVPADSTEPAHHDQIPESRA